jgi:hypothetical protein
MQPAHGNLLYIFINIYFGKYVKKRVLTRAGAKRVPGEPTSKIPDAGRHAVCGESAPSCRILECLTDYPQGNPQTIHRECGYRSMAKRGLSLGETGVYSCL